MLDNTGLELFGQGEWDAAKHGRKKRQWRKLHLAGKITDAGSGKVVTEGRALFVEVDLSHFKQGSGKPLEVWNDIDGTIPP